MMDVALSPAKFQLSPTAREQVAPTKAIFIANEWRSYRHRVDLRLVSRTLANWVGIASSMWLQYIVWRSFEEDTDCSRGRSYSIFTSAIAIDPNRCYPRTRSNILHTFLAAFMVLVGLGLGWMMRVKLHRHVARSEGANRSMNLYQVVAMQLYYMIFAATSAWLIAGVLVSWSTASAAIWPSFIIAFAFTLIVVAFTLLRGRRSSLVHNSFWLSAESEALISVGAMTTSLLWVSAFSTLISIIKSDAGDVILHFVFAIVSIASWIIAFQIKQLHNAHDGGIKRAYYQHFYEEAMATWIGASIFTAFQSLLVRATSVNVSMLDYFILTICFVAATVPVTIFLVGAKNRLRGWGYLSSDERQMSRAEFVERERTRKLLHVITAAWGIILAACLGMTVHAGMREFSSGVDGSFIYLVYLLLVTTLALTVIYGVCDWIYNTTNKAASAKNDNNNNNNNMNNQAYNLGNVNTTAMPTAIPASSATTTYVDPTTKGPQLNPFDEAHPMPTPFDSQQYAHAV